MYPVDHTNDPYVVGQNDNMVSINSCLEIDLYGQVASEAIGLNQYSGTVGRSTTCVGQSARVAVAPS